MSVKTWAVGQFKKPSGPWGSVAGWVMAKRPSNRERNAWTVELLQIQPEDRVLEIGFGPGLAVRAAASLAVRGFVAGVDHSAVMLRQASRLNSAAVEQGRVDLRLGSASSLPSFDAPFDVIFAVNVMMFWESPGERLAELRRLLKPGGRIAMTTQPRSRGATGETTRRFGEKTTRAFEEAGFTEIRTEVKPMKPVPVVCVLGANPSSGPAKGQS
jgi:SAM-dependent methyltransferase